MQSPKVDTTCMVCRTHLVFLWLFQHHSVHTPNNIFTDNQKFLDLHISERIGSISLACMVLLQDVDVPYTFLVGKDQLWSFVFTRTPIHFGISHGWVSIIWQLVKDVINHTLRSFHFIETISVLLLLFFWAIVTFYSHDSLDNPTITDMSKVIPLYAVNFAFPWVYTILSSLYLLHSCYFTHDFTVPGFFFTHIYKWNTENKILQN